MKNSDERKAEFFELLRRYVQLGTLLPEDLEPGDSNVLTEAKLVLAEMEAVKAEIDAAIEREWALRQ